jgi:hypothetical protein
MEGELELRMQWKGWDHGQVEKVPRGASSDDGDGCCACCQCERARATQAGRGGPHAAQQQVQPRSGPTHWASFHMICGAREGRTHLFRPLRVFDDKASLGLSRWGATIWLVKTGLGNMNFTETNIFFSSPLLFGYNFCISYLSFK